MEGKRVFVHWSAILTGCAVVFGASPAIGQTNGDATTNKNNANVIVVTATRSEQALEDVPASVTVQNIEELRAKGFTYGTDEYRGVPGVFFRRGEGDGDEFPFVSFRGSLGTEGSLSLIDGIPLIGLYEETQLNEVPYEAIERVEIVKGPVSALYGRGALYGATNYLTKPVRENTIAINLTGGSDDFYRAEASISQKIGENAGLLLSGSYENYDGWREQGGREIFNIFGKLDFEISDTTRLTAYANYNDRASELSNGRALDANGNVLPFVGGDTGFLGFGEPTNDTQNFFSALRLEQDLADDLELTLTGSYRQVDRNVLLNFFDPFGRDLANGILGFNGFRGDTSQDVLFGEATLRWQPEDHNIIAGVSAERSDITEFIQWTGQNGFTFECGFTFYLVQVDALSGNVLNSNNLCFVTDELRTDSDFKNTFWGAFIQDEITLSDRWFLTLGLRYDSFRRRVIQEPIQGITAGGRQSGKADAFSPKATISYRPDWGQIYFAYGRGFNSNFGATFEWDPVQYARPENRPTTIDSFEIGAKGSALDNALRFEAAAYYTRQKNRRSIIPNPAAEIDFAQPFSLITYGDLYEVKGAELSLFITPQAGTDFTISYSYIDPEWGDYVVQTFGGPVDYSGNTPTGVPQNIVYLEARQQVTDWLSVSGIFEFYDDYFYTVDNRFRDGGYELLTLGASIDPPGLEGVSIDLVLTNALDEDYCFYFGNRTSPTYAVPGPPRQFRAILKARF